MSIVLSFVLVEYHNLEEVRNCIASFYSNIKMPYEIIVSSNSCYNDKQKEQIKQSFPDVQWIFNKTNGGFAYAMNEGLKRAQGRYLTIMNSDSLITSNLNQMVTFIDEHPIIGAIGPQMVDQEGNIQDTARPYVTLPRYIWRQIKRITEHKTTILDNCIDYKKIQTVDWLIGAFIMVSRKAYEATGGLDEHYFMYAEDLDWCTRIRQQGFEIIYFPDTKVLYKGTRRARSNSKYAKIFICSHIRYWKKFGFFFGYPKRDSKLFL